MDFYCPRLRIAIEIDGDSHFSDEGILYDRERNDFIQSREVHVLRFTNDDVSNNMTEVIKTILEEINQQSHRLSTTPLSPPSKGGEDTKYETN